MQVIHTSAGGTLLQHREGYKNRICKTSSDDGASETVYTYFHQTLTGPTPGFKTVAKINDIIVSIKKAGDWKVFAVKFHPECKLSQLPPGDQTDFADKWSLYNAEIFEIFLTQNLKVKFD